MPTRSESLVGRGFASPNNQVHITRDCRWSVDAPPRPRLGSASPLRLTQNDPVGATATKGRRPRRGDDHEATTTTKRRRPRRGDGEASPDQRQTRVARTRSSDDGEASPDQALHPQSQTVKVEYPRQARRGTGSPPASRGGSRRCSPGGLVPRRPRLGSAPGRGSARGGGLRTRRRDQ